MGSAAAYAVYKWWYAEETEDGPSGSGRGGGAAEQASSSGQASSQGREAPGVLIDPRGAPGTTQQV